MGRWALFLCVTVFKSMLWCVCERGAYVTVVPWDHCLSGIGRWALFLCVTVFMSILWCLCERGGFCNCRAVGPLPFRHGSVGIVSLCYCV